MTISLSKQFVLGMFVTGQISYRETVSNIQFFNRRSGPVFKKLDRSFYLRDDVITIAAELLGKVIVTRWNGIITSGRIVETEAYRGEEDRASHAWGGRRTKRTEVMYGRGGHAYVYLCYGIHHLCNVVTHEEGTPHVVLIRAIEPLEGITEMAKRSGKKAGSPGLGSGPGNLGRSLGIQTQHSGHSLDSDDFYLADDGFRIPSSEVIPTPRIGVDYAGEDALLPYRFILSGNPWVSARKPQKAMTINATG
jgi:DNA-3-methyladenine glycosylase